MAVADIPQIADLTTAEKILLAEDLWESIASEQESVPVPESHKQELAARIAKHQSHPGNLLSLDELKQRIESSK